MNQRQRKPLSLLNKSAKDFDRKAHKPRPAKEALVTEWESGGFTFAPLEVPKYIRKQWKRLFKVGALYQRKYGLRHYDEVVMFLGWIDNKYFKVLGANGRIAVEKIKSRIPREVFKRIITKKHVK